MAADQGIPIFDSEIEQQVAYAESLTMGKTIFEWAARSPAAREVEDLTNELLKFHEQEIISDSTETAAAHG